MKFFLLINVKVPTIVGVLTFTNAKNCILGLSEPKRRPNFLIFFILMSIQNFMLNCVEHEKSFITSGPGSDAFLKVYPLVQIAWVFGSGRVCVLRRRGGNGRNMTSKSSIVNVLIKIFS